MYVNQIEFGTPSFDQALALRQDVLRKPLNMTFDPKDIALEFDSFHLGCYQSVDHELLGVLTLKPINANLIKMRQVAVSEIFQSKGVGSFLVSAAEQFAIHKGYQEIELHARFLAIPFYEKLKYVSKGKIFQEVGIDHIFMSKRLNMF